MATRKIKRNTEGSMSLEQAFREFTAEKEAMNLSEATMRNYVQSFNMLVMFTGVTTTEEVNISHIHSFIKAMKDIKISPASINHYLRDCRSFLYWCMSEERNYMKPFKVTLVVSHEEQIKLFTDEELKMLLEKPQKADCFSTWRTWAIVNWVLGTGNRAATICDIRLDDIDYSSKEIYIRYTKNKRAQIIPLSPSLELVLKEYINIWRYDADENGWLFPNVCEEKLSTNALRHSFTKYCNERGVSKTSIHGLRHNFAKGWVRNNGNMFVLQKILGHSTLEMTRKYVRLFSEDIKEDFDMFTPLDTIKRSSSRTQTIKRK